jgi:single-strand DNA-binding protein
MSASVNKVILIGNVGRDPEINHFNNGGTSATFTLATSETWKDKATNERKERTEWHKIVVFNEALVRVVQAYVKKGSKIYIEGQMKTRKWTDKSGVERYMTEVVLSAFRGELLLLDSGGSRPAPSPDDYGTTRPKESYASNYSATAPTGDLVDDDIPF